ncbi:MAG: hypothetical protein HY812_11475 [Planctomycetes bacterium]|nr:hypothetical protein [Planctomycetota bacterium]
MALVVLLRGINVGGHRTFRPAMLAKQLTQPDAVNIWTAGTFGIRRRVTRAKLGAELAGSLAFDAEIMMCGGREMVRVLSRRQLANQPERPVATRILAREGRFIFGVCRRRMKVIGYLGKICGLHGGGATAIGKVVDGGATDRAGGRGRERPGNSRLRRAVRRAALAAAPGVVCATNREDLRTAQRSRASSPRTRGTRTRCGLQSAERSWGFQLRTSDFEPVAPAGLDQQAPTGLARRRRAVAVWRAEGAGPAEGGVRGVRDRRAWRGPAG